MNFREIQKWAKEQRPKGRSTPQKNKFNLIAQPTKNSRRFKRVYYSAIVGDGWKKKWEKKEN